MMTHFSEKDERGKMMKSLRIFLDFGEGSNGVGWEWLWVIFIKKIWDSMGLGMQQRWMMETLSMKE